MVCLGTRYRRPCAFCAVLVVATGLTLPARGGDLFNRAKAVWHNHQGVPTAESLAVEIQCLEKHIDCYGTIVAKQPDVWGQARMMKHRQDFEQQIFTQLGKFAPSMQGSLTRSDQAFLASAMSLSAAASGAPAVQLPQSAATSQQIVARQRALLQAQGVANPTTAQLQQANSGTPTQIKPLDTNPAAGLVQDFKDEIQRSDLTKFDTGVNTFAQNSISLEPTEFLDQMSRYLNHLNELRRINEGDDTADSPGYALHLVRIPVSILPGTMTRKGYGAEITVTATPYLGRDLLPTTFRNLVINDVVSQTSKSLTEFFSSKSLLEELQKIRLAYLKAADEGSKAGPDPGAYKKAFDREFNAQLEGFLGKFGGSDKQGSRRVVEQFAQRFRFTSRSVPSERRRNARYAFPGTQMVEVYGEELILPVAFQTYDVVCRSALHDDPGVAMNVQYQRVAGHVQDQVVAAYDFLARQENAALWSNIDARGLANAVRGRDAASIKCMRQTFLASLPNGGISFDHTYGKDQTTATAAFAWAIVVESVLLNERLIEDIHETATAKGMPLPVTDGMPFYLPCPPDEARTAFNEYVRVRFPIHVFALDPVNQEQNIADALARTRELQLALSLAFVTGNMSAGNMTRFARRLETKAETIALNRTQFAFSHGDDVFGWRFQPRFQSPPTQNNLAAFGQLIVGGPTRDDDRRQLELEPGMRECVALVIMPSFVPYATFETRANWYRLNSPKHAEIDTLKFLELSKSVQRAKMLGQCLCDAGLYREGDVARLLTRVNQLSAELPMQTMIAQVPYENTHGGFELFNVGVTDLGPELESWYGAPGVSINNGTSLFLMGDSFSVNQTSVVVGNKLIDSTGMMLLSRQVMRVNVPPGVQAVTRSGRSFVEASVATPYGVSQSLFIPVVDGPATAAAPAGVSLDAKTRKLAITYMLQVDSKDQRILHAASGAVYPKNQKLTINWSNPAEAAPKKIHVTFDFAYKNVQFSIPGAASDTPIEVDGQDGVYTIDAGTMQKLAADYVSRLEAITPGGYTAETLLPGLESARITVTPVVDGKPLDSQAATSSNSLTIVATRTIDQTPSPTPPAPPPSPAPAPSPGPAPSPTPAPAPQPKPGPQNPPGPPAPSKPSGARYNPPSPLATRPYVAGNAPRTPASTRPAAVAWMGWRTPPVRNEAP